MKRRWNSNAALSGNAFTIAETIVEARRCQRTCRQDGNRVDADIWARTAASAEGRVRRLANTIMKRDSVLLKSIEGRFGFEVTLA